MIGKEGIVKMQIKKLVMVFVLLIVLAFSSYGATYYVSNEGNDQDSFTLQVTSDESVVENVTIYPDEDMDGVADANSVALTLGTDVLGPFASGDRLAFVAVMQLKSKSGGILQRDSMPRRDWSSQSMPMSRICLDYSPSENPWPAKLSHTVAQARIANCRSPRGKHWPPAYRRQASLERLLSPLRGPRSATDLIRSEKRS